jgi:hypothetical protein
MSAVRATNATTTPHATSVFLAQYDAPPAFEIQIVDGGASQFINANRHEYNDYEEFPVHARYTLTGVLATVHGTCTTKEVYTTVDGKKVATTLTKVLLAPYFVSFAPHGISRLFSQGRAQDAGATFTYAQDCTLTLPTGSRIPIRRLREWGLYGLMVEPIPPTSITSPPPTVALPSATSRGTS